MGYSRCTVVKRNQDHSRLGLCHTHLRDDTVLLVSQSTLSKNGSRNVFIVFVCVFLDFTWYFLWHTNGAKEKNRPRGSSKFGKCGYKEYRD